MNITNINNIIKYTDISNFINENFTNIFVILLAILLFSKIKNIILDIVIINIRIIMWIFIVGLLYNFI